MINLDSQIQYTAGCHFWLGPYSKKNGPYLVKDRKTIPVRRLLWEEKNGPIPYRMIVINTCRKHLCVKQDHLRLSFRIKG